MQTLNISSDDMQTYSILESQKSNIPELSSFLESNNEPELEHNEEADELELELEEAIELEEEANEMELELEEDVNEQESLSFISINSLDEMSNSLANRTFIESESSDDQSSELEEESSNDRYNPDIELSDEIIKGLRLLYIKSKYTLPDQAFNEIKEIFGLSEISLYRLQTIFSNIVPIKPILVDMCWNSCCIFNEENSSCEICSICGESRYLLGKKPKKARKSAAYFSIIDSLKMQYKDLIRAKVLWYRHKYTSRQEYLSQDKIGDIFDNNRYRSLVALGLFSDPRDIAFTISVDGYQLFKQKRNDC
ncbi:hypothetical protein C2G38_2049819 [Gigaspora rosea]|uniref:Uncharacterized protein n=1 Tax=Gigaspora rosea TaxID=44941 RepID=A0A397TZC9_9GLOM|nr:hypothetical protein C2G38_2049819 [Gigaspora rosea]